MRTRRTRREEAKKQWRLIKRKEKISFVEYWRKKCTKN